MARAAEAAAGGGLAGCRVLGAASMPGCPGLGVALRAGTLPCPGGTGVSERSPEGRAGRAVGRLARLPV